MPPHPPLAHNEKNEQSPQPRRDLITAPKSPPPPNAEHDLVSSDVGTKLLRESLSRFAPITKTSIHRQTGSLTLRFCCLPMVGKSMNLKSDRLTKIVYGIDHVQRSASPRRQCSRRVYQADSASS